jgi:tagatose 6-phosphate kinase
MIICLGTTPTIQRTMTFERLTLDAVNRAERVTEYASGKSVNVAKVLHELGHQDVIATGFAGGDRGRLLKADLDRLGISNDFVEVEAPTRLCITVVDESTGTATELVQEHGPVTPANQSDLLRKLKESAADASLIVLSGSLAAGVSPDFYRRCMETPSRVILDAVGEPLLQALPLRPFVIKPNQSEVARTLNATIESDAALKDAIWQLVERGAQWVVVTRGRAGAMISDGRSFWQVNTPPVKVISAIGSGDAFAAGLASGLASGQDVPRACVLAAACGSANAMTPHSGHLRLQDVQALTKQVHLTQL